ncbi:hypothetical protein [Runella sp.]|uniref:beta strand repeat-containing protein n=1 Tax=Runella sp. TaxID=1960881 RepID=UPI003D11BC77
MKNFTSLLSARIFYTLCLGSFFLSATLLSSGSFAQNGSPCYKPIIGPGTSATAVGTGVTIGFSAGNGINNLTNGNTGDFAEINNLAALVATQGVSVANANVTYPAGWHAGYVVQLSDAGLLNADVLGGIRIETYNNGSFVEGSDFNSGLGVTLLAGGSPDKLYINFKTTAVFDEVRIIKGTVVNAAVGSSNLRIYYATAFDPACGTLDNNGICYDQIAGNQTIVNFNAGLLNALATLTNPGNITDGNKETYASLVLPGGTDLASTTPYVGVKSLQTIYPSGNKAGFIVQKDNGLLSADLINVLSIRTYLHGELQDSQPASTTGLLSANVLAGANPLQELSITTTKPFNEVRLVATGVLAANLGTLRIYYAFESPATCNDCKKALRSNAAQPYTGALVDRDRDPGLGVHNTTAVYGLTVGTLVNEGNLVNSDTTDFARFAAVTGLLNGGVRMTVKRTGTGTANDYPSGTVAGFAVKSGSGILAAGLLQGITIRLYKDDAENAVQTITGASLVNLGLLSTGDVNFIGGKSTTAFDEMEIDFDLGAISVGLPITFDVYYAYVQLDTDNDGTPDCIDYCAGDDAIDSDGDGTPDACDNCSTANQKSASIDTDGDGLFNNCDTDSDNDGIPDAIEDTDTDGDPNDNDADGDGIPNYLDLDSDNDGITDLQESGVAIGGGDANNNGAFDAAVHTTTNTPKDTDGDGVPDYLDLDADNDSIFDLYEGGGTGYTDANSDGVVDGPDADNDGIQDSADANDASFGFPAANTPKDTDGDGVADYRDLDTDNDGINDIVEGGKVGVLDANNDGIVDGADADGDGIRDSADSDDVVFGSPGGSQPLNSDNDPIADYRDLDSDNDSVSDLVESGQTGYADADDDGVVDSSSDTDGDGIQNSVDGNTGAFGDSGSPAPKNTDSANDNIPDYRDTDSDNDTTLDIDENGRGGLDTNDDGMVDSPSDPDGDGIANNDGLDFKPNNFGGLGTSAPDLTPVIAVDGGTLNQNEEREVVIKIINNGDKVTSGPVVFTITKIAPTFSISINSTATSSVVTGNTVVANDEWTFTEQASRYLVTLKDGFSILPGSANAKKIVIKLTTTGTKSSQANLTVRIEEGTGGGETPVDNDIVTFKFSINL